MENLYNKNGLFFWTEEEIKLRNFFEEFLLSSLMGSLKQQNQAFQALKVEAPILTPLGYINKNYSPDDFFSFGDLALRPETTMGSYEYAKHILSGYNDIKYRPPIVIYQHGKSFRREQDQATKFMRLKEFYQLEFQIIYAENTKNDYAPLVFEKMRESISKLLGTCKVEASDRLPDYSDETMDIVFEENDMEVCSMSRRKDLEGYKVLEVAVGTDRLIYNFNAA